MLVRSECAGCQSKDLMIAAGLGTTPLADIFPASQIRARGLTRYDLTVLACQRCGLAQLETVVDDDLLYGPDYGFRTASSPSAIAHLQLLAAHAAMCRVADGLTVEIGCNDGTMLEMLGKLSEDPVLGIDPSGAARDAAARGLQVMHEPFTGKLARSEGLRGECALVVAVNVAAHVADPHEFMQGVADLLKPDGRAVVEFQYLPDLLAGCMFDLIYHEHRFFYSFGAFRSLASAHGLCVHGATRSSAQGGSLRVVLRKTPRRCDGDHAEGLARFERNVMPGLLSGFQSRVWYTRNRIIDAVRTYPGVVWGYGASAKSCTLLSYTELGPQDVERVVDITPGKLGCFTPGTGIPVMAPDAEEFPDAYLLLVQNYLGSVLDREKAHGYHGDFIVPLPVPVTI